LHVLPAVDANLSIGPFSSLSCASPGLSVVVVVVVVVVVGVIGVVVV